MIYDTLDLNILKTITTNKNKALEFAFETDLTKQNIFTPETWNFANTIVNYLKNYKELPTLNVLLEKTKNKKLADSIESVWKELDNVTVNDLEYVHNLEKIKKRFADKQIIAAQNALAKIIEDSIDVPRAIAEMQKAIGSINSISKNQVVEHKTIKEYLPTFVEDFNHKKNNPNAETGLKTYYNFIDIAVNGFKPADFMIIIGESGFGKSLLLQNIAISCWLQAQSIDKVNSQNGKNIIYFSLEMPLKNCAARMISRLSNVKSREIENASLSKEEFTKVKKTLDFIKDFPYHFTIVN
jgi:replicative DNA helicase